MPTPPRPVVNHLVCTGGGQGYCAMPSPSLGHRQLWLLLCHGAYLPSRWGLRWVHGSESSASRSAVARPGIIGSDVVELVMAVSRRQPGSGRSQLPRYMGESSGWLGGRVGTAGGRAKSMTSIATDISAVCPSPHMVVPAVSREKEVTGLCWRGACSGRG